MRISKYIMPTLKEDPADATVTSHKLMLRAGLIRKESAGMYAYLPLGFRVLQKVVSIVREEMNKAGAVECLMPELTNAELWKESGRWDSLGALMFKISDRNNQEYTLAPTHEEAITNLVRSIISSYRDLPVNIYQINTKFRDEIRPRFGVIRSKEFIMKDAYSFDFDEQGLEESYQAMRKTYRDIFNRCGIETIPVQADTGDMGGSGSEEFMVASEVGEEVLLLCDNCSYRANQEKAEYRRVLENTGQSPLDLKEVDTPNVKTIEELSAFFNMPAQQFLKSIIYVADDKPIMVVVPGDREVNEFKLRSALKAGELEIAPDDKVEEVTGAPVGFAGPVTDKDIVIIYDESIKAIVNGITGANKKDIHYQHVNPGKDFTIKESYDITSAVEGDLCPICGVPMYVKKGIEVGHIFKLGYKYTKSMNVTVLDEKGKDIHPIMGCYGIGVNRTVATIVEQNNDERGIMWPMAVAPFQIMLIGIAKTDEEREKCDAFYSLLVSEGYEVLYDDRKVSPGFKFADADLVGIPIRVTIGKSYYNNGEIEIKLRKETELQKISEEELVPKIKESISNY